MPLHWEIERLEGTASNGDDAILATSPDQWSDIARYGVLMVLSDSGGVSRGDSHAAATEVDTYYYQPPRPYDDPALCLADAITQAQFMVKYYPSFVQAGSQPRHESAEVAAAGAHHDETGRADKLTMIAGAVHRGTLYVAYTGNNRAYLMRDGGVEVLTIDTPPPADVGRGTYPLMAHDRVLLCTAGLHQSVSLAQIEHALKAEPRPRDVISTLLDAAAEARATGTVSIAVLDYTPSLTGITPPVMIGTGLVTLVALGVMALFISSRLAPQPPDIAQATATAPLAATATAPLPTQTARVLPTSTYTAVPSPTRPAAAVVAPTNTPAPTATTTPTPEPSPTPTASPTATRTPRPRARPSPTPTPTPTSTPKPAYAQPRLLSPQNNASFTGPDAPTFTWTSAGQLAADDYYVLAIQHSQGVDEQWVKQTSATAPNYLLILRGAAPFSWDVSVRRKTGNAPNGASVGTLLAQSAETWQFTWSPGEAPKPGGGNPPAPTSPPAPTAPIPPGATPKA